MKAQTFALKTNLVSDAALNVNLGFEAGLAPKWTLDTKGDFSLWDAYGSRKWKHWAVQPEARYWFCERFARHFVGVHVHGGQYNVGNIKNNLHFLGTDFSKLTDYRYQGWFVGAGVSYGYDVILGKHWNLEFEFGLGYSYTRYDQFCLAGCGKKTAAMVPHHYVGPTKLGINLVYCF